MIVTTRPCLAALGLLAVLLSPVQAQNAHQILGAAGVKGGFVVVIGCERPELLAELRAAGPYLVHALDRDPVKVAAAREYVRDRGLYGSVTVAQWEASELPYVDDLVQLIVVTEGAGQTADSEFMRVLAPLGAIADARSSNIAITRKPWPANLDTWSHYLHDASNNAVSTDTVSGPPRGLRWTCGPEYGRSHEHFASMSAMVTSAGRLFYIIDEGPIGSVYLPPQWKLVARDAFSGVLLWEHPISNWESHLRTFRSGPPEIGRRMVATKDRVYVSLGYGEPVTVLDAATGKQLATLAETSGARELLLANGVLYVLADNMTADQHEARKKWINRISPTLDIWYRFPREPIAMYGIPRIVAVQTASGQPLWRQKFKAPGEIMPTTLAVAEGKCCFQTDSHLVCLDAMAGTELWRSPRPVARSRFSWSVPTLVIHDGVVLCVDRTATDNVDKSPPAQGSKWIISGGGREVRQAAELVAFSLEDGRVLWRAPYSENYNVPSDIFVINGVVWVGNLRTRSDPGYTEGRDLKTGKVTTTFPPQKGWGHHRCYRNKATVRWILMGRGGMRFIDTRNGAEDSCAWARGTCQYGVMPANGLVYVPQHSCACQPREMLIGLNALAPKSSADKGPEPLERGPAYAQISNTQTVSTGTVWPTYRRDARRSGFQNLPAPGKPDVVWTRKLTAPITAPVVADGKVFVAEKDRHTLYASSEADGKPVWTFLADGRIDSPPTLVNGLCLFGTRSGFVYCLRSSDGTLVWRFRAAPRDRRLFAYEQLESVWPVHGSVLVDDQLAGGVPIVYFAAGRSSHLDGGIYLYALDVKTGSVLHKAAVNIGRGARGTNTIRQGLLPDILSAQKNVICMRGLGVDKNLVPVEDVPHLFAPRGFLDRTWWHRTYWVYGTNVEGGYQGWPLVGNVVPAGRLLVFDGAGAVYGYGRMSYREGGGHVGPRVADGYKLFAEELPEDAVLKRNAADVKAQGKQLPARRKIKWKASLPFVASSLVLTSDSLLVAGGPSLPGHADADTPGTLWVVSRTGGTKLGECQLPASPVLDGVAFAGSGVFVSSLDGSIACLRTSN